MTENNEKDIQVTEAVAAPATETAAPATTDDRRGGARRGERGDRGQGRGGRHHGGRRQLRGQWSQWPQQLRLQAPSDLQTQCPFPCLLPSQ